MITPKGIQSSGLNRGYGNPVPVRVKTVETARVLETPGLGFHRTGKPMVRSNLTDKEVGDRTVIEAVKTTVVFGGLVYPIVSLIPTTNLDEGCEFHV